MKRILLAALLFATVPSFAQDAKTQSNDKIAGCWYMPDKTTEHLQLSTDGKFFYQKFNKNIDGYETLTGSWQLMANNDLVLNYDDRPKQTLTVKTDAKGKITLNHENIFSFVKAPDSECLHDQHG